MQLSNEDSSQFLISEPSEEDAISILRGLSERYEVHHGVRITDAAIVAAVQLSNRYITDRFLPDKAIDLIDESASKIKNRKLIRCQRNWTNLREKYSNLKLNVKH